MSKVFMKMLDESARAASCDANVLIQGETGAGKEVWARAIHDGSDRADRPFMPVNCGTLSRELMESELFGHVKGAFTDATETRPGLLSAADGGTIFLDEIDALPPDLQVKLLRVLQNREFRPVGSTETLEADIRLIAASNTDLWLAVRTGRMREDLYYRLKVFHMTIAPLRERQEDILPLAEYFLLKFSAKQERPAPAISSGAVTKLRTYDWPGNVRELENAMERAFAVAENALVLTARDIVLGDAPESAFEVSFAQARARTLARFERSFVEALLAAHKGNVSRAAKAARMNRGTLRALIRRHGIDVAAFRPTEG